MRFFDPLSEFTTLRRELDRVFDTLRNNESPARSNAFPAVNIFEDEDVIAVEALIPGVEPDKMSINVLRNQLTISGEKPAPEVEEDRHYRSERVSGEFTRNFRLPSEVDSEKVTAEIRNGILRLVLPKAEAAKPKKISVAVA